MPAYIGRAETSSGPPLATDAELAAAIEPLTLAVHGLPPIPLRNVTVASIGSTDPKPVAVFGGYMWGAYLTTIYRSSDGGATWSTYCTGAPSGTIIDLKLTSSGEVLCVTASAIHLSTGWATSPTWTQKVTANGACQFQFWSVGGDGEKFISTEYAAGGNFADSRYCYISTDAGVTWGVAYDSVVIHGATPAASSHLHGCCYDPWSDRFYVAEGHGTIAGIYCSTNDGTTWSRADGMIENPAPTVIVATDDGLVCGSDSSKAGMFGVVRQDDPADEILTQTWAYRPGIAGTIAFGVHGVRDPDHGTVYIGFRAQVDNVQPVIAGGSPQSAAEVWRADAAAPVTADDARKVLIPYPGTLVAESYYDSAYHRVTGQVSRPSMVDSTIYDTGGVLKGTAGRGDGLAVGIASATSDTNARGTAVGVSASALGQDAVAVGYDATADNDSGTAVGSQAVAYSTGTAVGKGATTGAYSENVAVGADAAGTSSAAVAIGRSASAGNASTSVGRGASTSTEGVAVGYGATASHTRGVALGVLSATTATYQVAIGARHVELNEFGSDPAAGATNSARLYARDNGAGKTQLVVRFPTGAIQVIATEP